MPYQISEFPTVFLTELDQVLIHGTYSGRYFVQGAEFVANRTVRVPEIKFDGTNGVNDYQRFKSEGNVKLEYTAYTLGYDKEQTFYIDAVDDRDTAGLLTTNAVAEYLRLVFNPYVDRQFFRSACWNAGTKTSVALTTANIKGELRKVRAKFLQHGLAGGDLYITSEAKGILEDATNRQWASEANIGDVIGVYDGFNIIEAPKEVIGCDFLAIAGGQTTIRHIVKRAVSYLFEPGAHTQGDGWLAQLRWVFGDVIRKNRKVCLYCNSATALVPPEHDGSPVSDLAPLTVTPKAGTDTIFGHTVSALQTGITVTTPPADNAAETNGRISGTLKYVTEGQLPGYWGAGHFLALDFANTDANATAQYVSLVPSAGSGMGQLDSDMDASFKVTDPATQKLLVINTDGDRTTATTYDLSGLVLEEA